MPTAIQPVDKPGGEPGVVCAASARAMSFVDKRIAGWTLRRAAGAIALLAAAGATAQLPHRPSGLGPPVVARTAGVVAASHGPCRIPADELGPDFVGGSSARRAAVGTLWATRSALAADAAMGLQPMRSSAPGGTAQVLAAARAWTAPRAPRAMILAELDVPRHALARLGPHETVAAFVRIVPTGARGAAPSFERVDSSLDIVCGLLTLGLGPQHFTPSRQRRGRFEAEVVLGAVRS